MTTPSLDQVVDYLACAWHTIQVSPTKKARLHRNAAFSGAVSMASALFDRPQAELIEAAIARHAEHQKGWQPR